MKGRRRGADDDENNSRMRYDDENNSRMRYPFLSTTGILARCPITIVDCLALHINTSTGNNNDRSEDFRTSSLHQGLCC